ncbi:GNAT family N-acetyltransferase [Flavobacterium cupreum]|uniref:GNAT family N-acetyltransferase n=1 Tax=Flavobacterium cupreum TaxID=2133766 RepID=A0A434ADI7_9FLAO|nr:GNAT family N-acetyltransferase [Flavobacterium cupreum]RUT72449.1 GNAT family N-acetyltransferase [Flavobacterium cupreum]
MIIRKAAKKDMSAVLDLIKELARFQKEPNAVLISAEDLIREGFSDKPLFQCLVAEADDEIIGIALYYYNFSTWIGKTIHLEDLIVREDKRGTGAGLGLYSEIIRLAESENVKRVEWLVFDWNVSAIDFYKKTGAKVKDNLVVVQMDHHGITEFTK